MKILQKYPHMILSKCQVLSKILFRSYLTVESKPKNYNFIYKSKKNIGSIFYR